MKCPKCGYLGFEEVDRCRHCGFDLSFAAPPLEANELALQSTSGAGRPYEDYALADRPQPPAPDPPALDLDRLIGATTPGLSEADDALPLRASIQPDASAPQAAAHGLSSPSRRLPLFDRSVVGDELPAVAPPRPAGSPLAVRRSTPELPRARSKSPSRTPRHLDRPLVAAAEPAGARLSSPLVPLSPKPASAALAEPASRVPRTLAALFDLCLLGGISAGVIYLTLRIADLTVADLPRLQVVPMSAFLLILNGGYLMGFTAAGGRTIGKMLAGVQVRREDGRAVDASSALLRALGTLITVLTLGVPLVFALLSADRRALADRMAGTQVVRVR